MATVGARCPTPGTTLGSEAGRARGPLGALALRFRPTVAWRRDRCCCPCGSCRDPSDGGGDGGRTTQRCYCWTSRRRWTCGRTSTRVGPATRRATAWRGSFVVDWLQWCLSGPIDLWSELLLQLLIVGPCALETSPRSGVPSAPAHADFPLPRPPPSNVAAPSPSSGAAAARGSRRRWSSS